MENINIAPFWETKTLQELTPYEWEALCDGCGLCCLNRIQDEDDDEIYLTRVACHCYDINAGQCSDYENRHERVEGCMRLTIDRVAEYDWLPATCAYRLRYELKPLPLWHPLITKDPHSVRAHGMYALNPVLDDDFIDLEEYVVDEFSH
jgi:uncharacterized cysteine cluster protein YcgN (CxxCxxCC family)